MRLERVLQHSVVAGQNCLLLRARRIFRRAQQREQCIDILYWVVIVKREASPEPLQWGCASVGSGGIENEVEPFLRLTEAPIVAVMNGNHHGDMVNELVIIVGIGAAWRDVNLLIEVAHLR